MKYHRISTEFAQGEKIKYVNLFDDALRSQLNIQL
jgi:hypothetical protein